MLVEALSLQQNARHEQQKMSTPNMEMQARLLSGKPYLPRTTMGCSVQLNPSVANARAQLPDTLLLMAQRCDLTWLI